MIILYTLPTCPICEMVKKKLANKNITYQEVSFEFCELNTDRAPVLFTGDEYLMSPVEINKWIMEA